MRDGPSRSPFRVLSYNVRYAGLDEGWVAWDARRDAVASTVHFHRPDLLSFQEVWMGQFEDLRERLPGYEWVAHPDRNGEHTPIAFRPERFDLRDSGAFGLAPDGERGVPAWGASVPRQVTHATFADREADARFDLFSVHLDHESERARREGAEMVLDRLPEGPVVVAGDCNCTPGSAPYRTLAGELTDAREAVDVPHGPAETYVGFEGEGTGEASDPERKRIDYAFTRGFDVEGYGVGADVDADWHHPSDHLPVVADLAWRA